MSLMTHTRERNVEGKTWSGSPLKVPEGARFLIVCDDNSDTDRLKVILREAGSVSEWAKSITEGCEAAKSGPISGGRLVAPDAGRIVEAADRHRKSLRSWL